MVRRARFVCRIWYPCSVAERIKIKGALNECNIRGLQVPKLNAAHSHVGLILQSLHANQIKGVVPGKGSEIVGGSHDVEVVL